MLFKKGALSPFFFFYFECYFSKQRPATPEEPHAQRALGIELAIIGFGKNNVSQEFEHCVVASLFLAKYSMWLLKKILIK
jgi:hypothetical protein